MRRSSRKTFVAISLVLLAGAGLGFLAVYLALRPPLWKDDWKAPPGFSEMLADLSAGRANDGEAEKRALFRRHRSPVWRQRADLALGIARLRRKEYQAALQAFGRAARGGVLSSFIALKRGDALLGAGSYRDAQATFEEARRRSEDPVLSDDLAIGTARALSAQGLKDLARRSLVDYLGSPACRDKARVMEVAATIAEESGDRDGAIEMNRRIYLEQPRTREATSALERLDSLAPASSRFTLRDLPNVAGRARTLIDAGEGRAALATWDTVLASLPGAAADPRWRLEITEAAIEAKQPARAVSLLGSRTAPRGDTQRAWLLGRALFGLGRDNEAIANLRAAAAGHDEHAEDALFLLATSLDQTDKDQEGLARFLDYIHRYKDTDRMHSALWRAGWLSYRLGKRDEARALFQRILDMKEAVAYHPSAIYWLGRGMESARRTSSAIGAYQQIVSRWSRDYYGLLAAERLRALGVSPSSLPNAGRATASPAGSPSATDPSPPTDASAEETGTLGQPPRALCDRPGITPNDVRVREACELETIGLFQDAEKEYDASASTSHDRAVLLRLSEIAMRRGDRAAAIVRLKAAIPDYLGAPIGTLPRRFWEVLFPRSEWTSILQASRSTRLDPNLVCGLILQESAFNPLAVSQAGALGLMQVLPRTGDDAARALGETQFRPARLLEPSLNIRVGTWHLAEILRRMGGQKELALAAYNAGEARVRHWRSVFGTSEPASFVEEIPYTETRLYVKRILSHAAMYHAIYGP